MNFWGINIYLEHYLTFSGDCVSVTLFIRQALVFRNRRDHDVSDNIHKMKPSSKKTSNKKAR
jgi:hypothetical protein